MIAVLVLCLVFSLGHGSMPRLKAPTTSDAGTRIIQGENANEGQFPYMVSLNIPKYGHTCGASILTRTWALTAAHCITRGMKMEVFAGNIYLSGPGQTQQIARYVVHPNYDPNNYWENDICAIQLRNPLNLNENVQQITLPTQDWPVNDGDLLTISGWGYTDPSDLIIPDRLQVGYNFEALSNDRCSRESGIPVTEAHLCAYGGSEGEGVCNGDSGGPLVKDGVQVGITSFGFIPCGSGYPDFYCRVPHYIDWIIQTLGKDAKDLKFIEEAVLNTTTHILKKF